MNCCDCHQYDKFFDAKKANQDWQEYQTAGLTKSTKILVEFLRGLPLQGKTILDIGGGIGALQIELLKAGATSAVSVEASGNSIAIAKQAATAANLSNHITHIKGDFAVVADQIDPTDIVVLDKVLCCYPDMPTLVTKSAAKAKEIYAAIYPRDTWWIRAYFALQRLLAPLLKAPPQHIHRTAQVERILQDHGFTNIFRQTESHWQIAVFQKNATAKIT